MALWAYPFLMAIYRLALRLTAWFSGKARERVSGSTQWKQQLGNFSGNRTIWIHCASLGEFEQGRPVLDAISKGWPDRDIVLSFYSPSGYRIRKNYSNATRVVYLPEDTRANARAFLDLVQPELFILVKYDFWYYFLEETRNRNIPAILVAARFFPGQKYFSGGLRSLYLNMLATFRFIFVQDQGSFSLLQAIPELKGKAKVAGDPRFDRVMSQVMQPVSLPDLETFIQGRFCVIAGSTWPADDAVLLEVMQQKRDERVCWIVAPHEYSESSLKRYKRLFSNCLGLLSDPGSIHPGTQIILVDRVGYLSSLYSLADLAYIGGGQHHRIHNIQEPAAWGVPLAFGPRHQDFPEAGDLLHLGGARVITRADELINWIDEVRRGSPAVQNIRNTNRNYIQSKSGATGRIISTLQAAGYL